LQSVLAARIARAAWRLERAERIEAELFEHHLRGDRNLGQALIRDGNGARAFDTLLRYRGTTLAELWRALRLLKALQAEAADRVYATREREPDLLGQPGQTGVGEAVAAPVAPALPEHCQTPVEPEACTNARETAAVPTTRKVVAAVTPTLPEGPPVHGQTPIEPEPRGNPGEITPASAADGGRCRAHKHLAAHEATQKCVTHASLVRHSCAVPASPSADSA
jgi:hypothetical protein